MNRLLAIAVLGTFIACSDSANSPVAPDEPSLNDAAVGSTSGMTGAGGAVYTGRAIAVDATVGGSNTKLCSNELIQSKGGKFEQTVANPSIAGLLSASSLYCITVSMGMKSAAEATVRGLNLTVAGVTITADLVHSMAGARCPPLVTSPTSSGIAFVTNLRVNGRLVPVKANTANQKFELPGGSLGVNEQSFFFTPFHAGRTVIGLHIVINRPSGTADIILARAQMHIDCP